jgi:hypothetical protein
MAFSDAAFRDYIHSWNKLKTLFLQFQPFSSATNQLQ